MLKRLSAIILMLLTLCTAVAEEDANLVYNGDFALLDAAGYPDGWAMDAWVSANSEFRVDTLDDGTRAVYVNNLFENDARWIQTVAVEPNTDYAISFRVRADGISGGLGANVSIMNSFTYSDSSYDTQGEWIYGTLYGVTGDDQSSLVLALRVGGYNYTSTGGAWFADVSMVEMSAPPGKLVSSFATLAPSTNAGKSDNEWDTQAPKRYTEQLAVLGFAVLLIAFAMITHARRIKARGREAQLEYKIKPIYVLSALLAAAFVLRVVIAYKVRGYSVDIGCFLSWSETMRAHGIDFYQNTSFCDYPPLYLVCLGVSAWLRQLFAISYGSPAHIVLIKLMPMLCDIALSYMAYSALNKRFGWRRALLGACAIAFNPAFIVNSAAWGQIDSVLALLITLCVLNAARGKWLAALPIYAVAVLVKPQALLFGPLGLAALGYNAWSRRKDARALLNMLYGLIACAALIYFVSLPFAIKQLAEAETPDFLSALASPVSFLKSLYVNTASGYQRLTVNACNLYELMGLNWANMESHADESILAWALFALSYVLCLALFFVKRKTRNLPLLGALLISLIFCFAPMMHERYLFPALALLLFAYALEKDYRLLIALAISTCAQFLNISLVLQGGVLEKFAEYGHLQSNEAWINHTVSALNMLSTAIILWAAADICLRGHRYELPRVKRVIQSPAYSLKRARDHKLHMRARDYMLMGAITLVYAFAAFINLGDTQAPETGYNSASGEQIIFDLGETRTFRLTYYGGIASSTFTVSLSNDGVNWTEDNYAAFNEGMMFQWIWYAPNSYEGAKFEPIFAQELDEFVRADTGEGGARVNYAQYSNKFPTQTARFVRVTTVGYQLKMHEYGFLNPDTGEPYPIIGVSGSRAGADYTPLIDEQHKVAPYPSYKNGMYFDEIYHARTAYEFANDYAHIFETSHPHLGKILIMVGIKLFGMTPFGWRCAGALAGVLMLPIMYLIVKQLTKRTNLAFIATFLLSVDSMHFTQTRIATVDSFAVLFIMTMYLFMFRYLQMNMNKQPLLKTFVPLALSGLFMGFACAAKWIGVYASIGLALLFFIAVFERLREYIGVRRALKAGNTSALSAAPYINRFPSRLWATLGFCVIAFVVVPLIIYYFSFYYHFANTAEGLNISAVWKQQLGMFNYHYEQSDPHYFQSEWYEWPVIAWPMWYFSSDIAYLGRGVVSSISCMGNPAIWWVGLVAILCVYIRLCVCARPGRAALYVGVGFASQYMPWLLISRSTFIYHYFASVPFIIIATVLMLNEIRKKDKYAFLMCAGALMLAALALFALFYPLESGVPCSYEHAKLLRWFDWYNFAPQ